MRILILYDSLYGNTEKVAYSIGEITKTNHETNIIKVNKVSKDDLKNKDLLVVGSPTHGGRFSNPMKKFLDSLPKNSFEDIKAVTFDTSFPTTNMGFFINHIVKIFGNAAPRLAKELSKKGAMIIDSKVFFVIGKEGPLKEGEIEKAKKWMEMIITNIELSS